MRTINSVLLLALTLFSSLASAEILFLNCVHHNHHDYTDSMILTLDTDRKIFGFTYMGYGGDVAFIEEPAGSLVKESYITIDRYPGDITVINANIMRGTKLNPVFMASAEITLEKATSIHYYVKAARISHGGSPDGYPIVQDFVGEVCNIVPTAK